MFKLLLKEFMLDSKSRLEGQETETRKLSQEVYHLSWPSFITFNHIFVYVRLRDRVLRKNACVMCKWKNQ